MRVIAGTRKGLRLQVPLGRSVRPTPDRVREALMSILGGFFDGELVLDICAGTGAVGIEMLSRGCGSVVFVERGAEALASLRLNLKRARFDGPGDQTAEVLAVPADRALARLKERGARFDYVYLDPPYDGDVYGPTLISLADGALLRGGAQVWVESRKGLDVSRLPPAFRHVRSRRFGSSTLDLLQLDVDDD
jgi:16S rRNA (guanine966-N2)-methyltransferase